MRLASKNTLLLLAVYALGIAGLIAWTHVELRRGSTLLVENTARLMGKELAAALTPELLEEISRDSPRDRRAMLARVREMMSSSEMIAAVTVVNARGKVVASDEFVEVGTRLTPPSELFDDPPRPRFLGTFEHAWGAPRYLLEVPLVAAGGTAGYLRLSLDVSDLEEIYRGARRRLFLMGVLGLLVVGGLGFLLHVQLARRGRFLRRAIEDAMEGHEVPPTRRQDEFTGVLEAAGRLGRELSEERERSSTARGHLSRVARLLDVGVVLLDSQRRIDFASQRARELLGLSEGGGGETWALVQPQLENALEESWRRRADGAQVDVGLARDGERTWLRCQIHLLDEEECVGFLILVRDRSTLSSLEEDLRLAVHLRGLTRLYMGVAHDLKAPLNAMGLNLELLRRSLEDGTKGGEEAPRRRRWLAVVEEELERLRRSLDLLLAQTAPERQRQESFDLREILHEVEALLAPQARQQDVSLEVRHDGGGLLLHGRRDQLKQALLSLAINALEAMPRGGELVLSVARADGEARLRVADTGPGIPREIRERIFAMHFTTKSTGTGAGLFVARSIVESHGGALEVVGSEPGEGTIFEMRLPVQKEEPHTGTPDND